MATWYFIIIHLKIEFFPLHVPNGRSIKLVYLIDDDDADREGFAFFSIDKCQVFKSKSTDCRPKFKEIHRQLKSYKALFNMLKRKNFTVKCSVCPSDICLTNNENMHATGRMAIKHELHFFLFGIDAILMRFTHISKFQLKCNVV